MVFLLGLKVGAVNAKTWKVDKFIAQFHTSGYFFSFLCPGYTEILLVIGGYK